MLGVFLVEFLNPSGSIDKFLLAGKKRMAGGTDFNMISSLTDPSSNSLPQAHFAIILLYSGCMSGFTVFNASGKRSHQIILCFYQNFKIYNFRALF